MSKKRINPLDNIQNEHIINKDLRDEMEESILNYSIKTISDRAIPDVRDGLKPVLRRILYAMYQRGITPDKHYVKNADIVGDVMGKYHPHGDGSIYDALSRASQWFSYRYPLIDFHGNNGSLDGDSPAAYRYTEGRLDKKALWILKDVDKDTVDYKPNYSEKLMEPVVLPALFPNLLVNGASGIATGYTTEIPSHNLNEVVDAIIATIKNPDITIDELLTYIKGPDLPIGAQLIYNEKVKELYENGKASLRFRATFKIEENEENGNTQIVFTSLPPDVNKPKLLEKLYELCIEKKSIPKVIDVRDEQDGDEIRIVVELHKTAVPDIVVSEIFSQTQLDKTKGFVMIALVNQAPKVLNLKQIIEYYIEHQRNVISRKTKYELNKTQDKLHVLEGFSKILANIDDVISIIRSSETTQEAAQLLMEKYQLSDTQVKSILDMPLRRLTKLEANKVNSDIEELKNKIAYYQNILSSQLEVDNVLIDELIKLKEELGDERKTEIVLESELNNSNITPVTNEEMAVVLTSKNTIKQLPLSALEEIKKGGYLRERQEVFLQAVKCTINDEFVLILNTGEYVKVTFNDLLGNLEFTDSKIIKAIVKLEQEDNGKVVMAITKKGLIVKSPLTSFRAKRKRIAPFIKLSNEEDEIVDVKVILDNCDDDVITVVTDKGTVHRFFVSSFSISNPGSKGVGAISSSVIEEGQNIIGMEVSNKNEDEQYKILLYLEDSQGIGIKTMRLDEFKPKGRVSKGITGTEFRRGSGIVHKFKIAKEDFFILDEKGKVHHQKIVSILNQNRYNKPIAYDFIPLVTNFTIQ